MAYQLQNGNLVVDIAEVGDYRGTRFDWTGFITGVMLTKGDHKFCVPESLIPGLGTDGSGMCSEFGLSEAIGYDETKPGDKFPKLGIGLLTRPDEAEYRFHRDYEVEPFQVEVKQEGPWSLSFTVLPEDCRGFAAKLEKRISLKDNLLLVDYKLHNTGAKAIRTEEYCHNFLGIDERPVGPDYVLKFPFAPNPWNDEEGTMDGLVFQGTEVSWERQPNKAFYFRLKEFAGEGYPWLWELLHRPSGTGVRELSRIPVAHAAVWGMGHVVSPEMFFEIKLAPGESKSWTRIYEFFRE